MSLTDLPAFVLEPREFRVLEGLHIAPRKSFTGRVRGERLTKRKGVSIEFADYRDYTDGDDLRHLDWNVLARLETPVIKTYQDEEDLAVHILLDCSASMDFGETNKLTTAVRLGSAMAYLALCGQDAVYPRAMGLVQNPLPALRGRSSFPRFTRWVQDLEPVGATGIAKSAKDFAGGSARPGVAMLITDALDPDIFSAVRVLGGRGHEIWLIQILSDEELDPDLEGDLRLLDAEAGGPVEITANSYALETYKKNLSEHNAKLEQEVLRLGGRYALFNSAGSIEEFVKSTLKRHGWVTT